MSYQTFFYIHEIYSSFCLCHVILFSDLAIALLRLLAEEDIAAICGFRCRALVICLSHKLARAISHLLQYIVELLLWRQHHQSHAPYSHSGYASASKNPDGTSFGLLWQFWRPERGAKLIKGITMRNKPDPPSPHLEFHWQGRPPD